MTNKNKKGKKRSSAKAKAKEKEAKVAGSVVEPEEKVKEKVDENVKENVKETKAEENVKEEEEEEDTTSVESPCLLCGRAGSLCSPCREVQLCPDCSPRHKHRGRCLPWTVKETRGEKVLTASRTIRPLEVVVTDLATVTVPLTKLSCAGCGRAVSCLYSCPHCQLPLCGTQCPRADHHAVECRGLSQSANTLVSQLTPEDKHHPIFTAIGCIRLLDLKKNNRRSFLKLRNLNRKLDQIKEDPAAAETLRSVREILEPCGYREEEVEDVFCLLRLYSYTLPDLEDSKVRSLFPVQALLSHSCLPNLQYIEAAGGRKIVLQATTKIQAGERLTVRLTPFLQGRLSLGQRLRDQRYLTCSCPRCSDSTELGTFTSAALCDGPGCAEQGGLILPINPRDLQSDWICTSCQVISSQANIEAIEEKYIERFSLLAQGDLAEYYRFLNELGERFHASHHLVMRMAQFLVLLQGKRCESLPRERIETQTMLCDKLLNYVSRLDPGATVNRAKLLLEKNKADLLLAKLDYEAGKITRNVFMNKIKEGVRIEVNAKKILYFKWED